MKPKTFLMTSGYFLFVTAYLLEMNIIQAIIISIAAPLFLICIKSFSKRLQTIGLASYSVLVVSSLLLVVQQFDKIKGLFNFYL